MVLLEWICELLLLEKGSVDLGYHTRGHTLNTLGTTRLLCSLTPQLRVSLKERRLLSARDRETAHCTGRHAKCKNCKCIMCGNSAPSRESEFGDRSGTSGQQGSSVKGFLCQNGTWPCLCGPLLLVHIELHTVSRYSDLYKASHTAGCDGSWGTLTDLHKLVQSVGGWHVHVHAF